MSANRVMLRDRSASTFFNRAFDICGTQWIVMWKRLHALTYS